MANRNNRFVKGSTTFICDCCGHNTRFTGDQSLDSKLCPACWDLAGYENMIQDDCFHDNDAKEVVALFDLILKRSAAEHAKAIKSHDLAYNHELVKAASIQAPIETKKQSKKVETKSTAKYDYPAGLTQAQKKVFRAKARRSK